MRIAKIPGQIVESVLSIAGIRIGTEEPHYLRQPLTEDIEVRRYGPRLAAETSVDGAEDRARSIGFRRLAGYIFGANHREETISMTASVAQQSDRDEIAMTAPVAQSRNVGDRGRFGSSCRRSGRSKPCPSPMTTMSVSSPCPLKRSQCCDSVATAAPKPSPSARTSYERLCARRRRTRGRASRVVLRPAVDLAVPASKRDRHSGGRCALGRASLIRVRCGRHCLRRFAQWPHA